MGVLQLGMSLSGGSMDAALSELEARLNRLSGPIEAFGRTMMDSVARNFDEHGRPDRWQPLSESTLRRKGNDTILVDTGRLRGSIGYRVGRDSLTVYAEMPYASVHQLGGSAGRGKAAAIPARPFLVFQDEDVGRLVEMLTDHLLNQY